MRGSYTSTKYATSAISYRIYKWAILHSLRNFSITIAETDQPIESRIHFALLDLERQNTCVDNFGLYFQHCRLGIGTNEH
jgi:hypothetical protein